MSKKSLYQKSFQRNQSLFIARGGGGLRNLSIEREGEGEGGSHGFQRKRTVISQYSWGVGVLMVLRVDKGISQYLSRGGLRVFYSRAYGH